MISLLLILCLSLVGIAAWALYQASRRPEGPDPALALIQQEMNALRDQMSNSLSQNTGTINQRLDNAARLYGELRSQLGQLSESNTQIQAMVKDVSSLQDILRPPKLRGGMGEVLLENLLREILPAQHYELQYRFRTGNIVDGVIKLKEGLVPVDAKFPLENFRRMLDAKSDEERKSARREFARNVKKHIDDIHEKYILTEEGTFPFALMYIPAENVYYETIIKADEEDHDKALYAYATTKQVMPVSPNSFYAYLLTLAQGFRGMRIEEKAQEILGHLSRLGQELNRFSDDFQMVGRHLGNAQTKFDDAEKRLARFQDKLQAAGDSAPQIEETGKTASLPKEITTH
jgi:DNA recombination protein RmuC